MVERQLQTTQESKEYFDAVVAAIASTLQESGTSPDEATRTAIGRARDAYIRAQEWHSWGKASDTILVPPDRLPAEVRPKVVELQSELDSAQGAAHRDILIRLFVAYGTPPDLAAQVVDGDILK